MGLVLGSEGHSQHEASQLSKLIKKITITWKWSSPASKYQGKIHKLHSRPK